MNLVIGLLMGAAAYGQAPDLARLEPVPFTEVKISDRFWAPRLDTNRKVSIPHVIDQLYATPRMQNLIRAGNRERGDFKGLIFDDSDVYKVLESAAYALAERKDPALEKRVDEMIAILAKAQMPDGYLNSWYQLMAPERRFTNLRDNHELYCAGHLFEAAVAHYRATGKKSLLDVATKFADLLVNTFGPGKRMGYPGHPETELALFKLAEATGNKSYFELGQFFVENRGSRFFAEEHKTPIERFNGTYWLDDMPIREHREIKGHAVRAAYLFSGVADLANANGDPGLVKVLDRVWKNTVYKRVFVTGGIGPSASNEGFTTDYDLPTFSAYQETCASLAMVFWNHRMGLLHGDAKYWDEVERSLYNGALAGINLKGDRFFYVNPLASHGNHHRTPWFACACCPPNLTRTLASLGGYAYAKSKNDIYVNLLIGGEVATKVGDQNVRLKVETNYPWDGKVVIRPSPGDYLVHVRIPDWYEGDKLGESMHGEYPNYATFGYAGWKAGAKIEIDFKMPVRRVMAHPGAKDVAGSAAIQRGPLIYALEQADHAENVHDMVLPLDAELVPKFDSKLLGGVTVLEGTGKLVSPLDWRSRLYAPIPTESVRVKAIPYYAWDNRQAGPMAVWIPFAPPAPTPGGLEKLASVKVSSAGSSARPLAIRDGKAIEASNKHPGDLCHFWPKKGTDEYVEYGWKEPQNIGAIKVYWFDDTGFGECRPPASWSIQYLDGGTWRPVQNTDAYATSLDKWVEIKFKPVKTSALRLVLKLQPNWSVGIHEWQVIEVDPD